MNITFSDAILNLNLFSSWKFLANKASTRISLIQYRRFLI